MANVLPKERDVEMQETRVSVPPPAELPPAAAAPLPPPPSRRPYGPGDSIDGKYQLESLLGQGGMGEVWIAKNETLGVRRAVKLIRADTGSAESTDRLLHEAQAAARLADPSIVRVFDFGKTASGDPYIVMELLEGEDLMSIINRRERLSPTKAVRVLLPLIRALGTAHAHGIVHRDLKPENIFLAKLPDGRVQPKLLDFGIAKLKNARELRLTTAGAVMGSPLYMAPEQARGEDVDERVDIWAMCVVLYEAITGSPPFTGDDRAQVMRAVADLEPKSLDEHGVTDSTPWPVIARGLRKRRDDRFQTMDELGRALAGWLLDAGVVDDISGASLEAGWFKSSRHSLFASSLPPERRSGGVSGALGAGLDVGHGLWPAIAKARVRFRVFVGRAGVRGVALGALVTGGALLAFGALGGEASKPATPPREIAPSVSPPRPAVIEATIADAHPEAPGSPALATPPPSTPAPEATAPHREPSRPKSPRAGGPLHRTPRERARPDRRSKLIDPYQ